MNQNVVLIFLKDDAKVIWGKGKGLFFYLKEPLKDCGWFCFGGIT